MTSLKLHAFFRKPEGIGALLFLSLCAALVVANSPWETHYHALRDLPFQVGIGNYFLNKPLLLWINDGLMSLFFLTLALEIKREMLDGDLSSTKKALLPCVAALGGVFIPAIIYLLINPPPNTGSHGWPIPTATDVALSLAAVAALGSRVPSSLKTFLMALAIVDDVIAIAIIALVYSHDLSSTSIAFAFFHIILLLLFNLFRIKNLGLYLLVGISMWLCVLNSGIHATLAGVILGFCIPSHKTPSLSPLVRLQNNLHTWVSYLILPVFIFFNGGLALHAFNLQSLTHPVSLGIILGLWLGKTFGIFTITYALVKLKLAHLPAKTEWPQFLGISAFAGIGFTMSLFLASLAFENNDFERLARQGIFIGSILALITGTILFLRYYRRHENA